MWSYISAAIELALFLGTAFLFLSTRELHRQCQLPEDREAPDLEPLRGEMAALIYQMEKSAGELEGALSERCREMRATIKEAREEREALEKALRARPAKPEPVGSRLQTDPPPGELAPRSRTAEEPYLLIPRLARQGLKKAEIARELRLGQEEVELALELAGGGTPGLMVQAVLPEERPWGKEEARQ